MNILNKLTIKHLKMNKKRTIVTIVGIILSTALMVGIGLLLSTFREGMIEEVISSKGDYNVRINDVNSNNINMIKNNLDIEKYITRSYIGYAVIDESLKGGNNYYYYKIFGINDDYMKHLRLINGRYPLNNNEIVVPSYLVDRFSDTLKVGEDITILVGDRYLNGKKLEKLDDYNDGEYIGNGIQKTYKIVGIIDKDYYEDTEPGCFIYTKDESNDMDVFITFKKPNKTFKLSPSLVTSLGIVYESNEYYDRVSYNNSLLSFYGTSKYSNMISSLSGMLAIMLGLVSVACVIVIYNSFAISVMERKKQFGLMSSIGATKRQIRHTVLYEAFIVSIIGIPLGILASYIGIGIVVTIMDNLLKGMLNIHFKLVTYPLFIIIPIIFMLITIFISAIIPAKKASKISPIEAIRLNDDIKIKGNKVKSPKIIRKLFGTLGDIAYKNMKRNKKKYRITVVSLFISVVLFISSSAYMTYIVMGSSSYVNVPDLDITLSYSSKADKDIVNSILKHKEVEEYSSFRSTILYTDTDLSKIYSSKYIKFLKDNDYIMDDEIKFLVLDNDSYNRYLSKIGKNEKLPILYNGFSDIVYSSNSRKNYNLDRYNNKIIDISICDVHYDEEVSAGKKECFSNMSKYYITNETFIGLELFRNNNQMLVIISDDMVSNYKLDKYVDNDYYSACIKAPTYKELDELVKNYDKENKLNYIYYLNIHEELKQMYNLIFVIKLLVYGFIALVTLIGVTSVFNTINTSIALRRKEFAVLRSVGLTPEGFNKMLRFESLFFGIKSLIYALPVSLGVTYLIHLAMSDTVSFDSVLIPWKGIILAVIGVFVIVAISMMYATKKVKNDNILDAIREENI